MRSDVCPLQPSGFEFNFDGGHHILEFESRQSFADELFADGMILPIFHRPPNNPISPPLNPRNRVPLPPPPKPEKKAKRKPVLAQETGARPVSRSFCGFINGHNKKRLAAFFTLPPLLSRSNSTGSVPTPKPSLQKQASAKKMVKSSSFSASSSTSTSSMSGYDHRHHHRWNQKAPSSRKTSPVLNVPSPYIIAATNLFGLSSLLRNGKDKKKIRR
ncbi:hypothetical protein SAY87_026568 [Trapa incisa]|uniref:Uncharacterized protein n=1 Tax=Trapa incisa TaxID=236973 RepID=A0AAN7GUQ6_9MYRT|nr:hypothetical protein SAY87_026568 [Trapa incisa]